MNKAKSYEMIYLPAKIGMIKVYMYGFHKKGDPGRVFVMLNDLKVNGKGTNKKETLISTLSKLNELINQS
ncbi:hypothetical protein F7984_05985 [Pradoshia sp. D12]|jgi:hypothetical protein|uniref:hypothetical protein n=1 Tax=Bacillaceae TaxID=186817 RepID=UPI00080AE3AE|nr:MULTISPECIES: hypothetical protein [Bacillaceae]OCA89782.1 hypothetical protein A8L44_02250 [Bacillus sp. FJAT-27986]QFK70822.1 hypothetical protein F7984_05985 [Pradoshia sp. D12]TPF72613.1 hypothetical protein FHY44_02370 [Bacillus sp. D12]